MQVPVKLRTSEAGRGRDRVRPAGDPPLRGPGGLGKLGMFFERERRGIWVPACNGVLIQGFWPVSPIIRAGGFAEICADHLKKKEN